MKMDTATLAPSILKSALATENSQIGVYQSFVYLEWRVRWYQKRKFLPSNLRSSTYSSLPAGRKGRALNTWEKVACHTNYTQQTPSEEKLQIQLYKFYTM